MKKYELMVILNPELSEEDRTTSLQELQQVFADNNVKVVKEDTWGDKKLAYKINKSDRGFYMLYQLEMDGKNIKDMSKTINLDGNIWRYMFSNQED